MTEHETRQKGRAGALLLLLLLVAIGLRIYGELVYVDLNLDKARQLRMAQSFAGGQGFDVRTADPADLSRVLPGRSNQWPIGYPFLVATLAPLCGGYLPASQLLDVLAVLALVLALHSILGSVGASDLGRAWFLAFTGLTFTPYLYLGSTDLWSVACYLVAIAWTVGWYSRADRILLPAVGVGVLLFGGAFFRYPFLPLAALIPGCLVGLGGWRRERRLLIFGVVAGGTAGILILGMLTFQHHHFGAALRSTGSAETYLANLAQVDAFPLESVVYTKVYTDNLHLVLPDLDSLVRVGELLLSALILLVALAPCAPAARAWFARSRPDRSAFYHGLALATVAANVGLLLWFSFRNPPQQDGQNLFTHVQETRYYAPSMLLIQIGLVVVLVGRSRSTLARSGRIALAVVMALTVAYAGYRGVKVHALGDRTTFDYRNAVVERTLATIRKDHGSDLSAVVYADGLSFAHTCLVGLRSEAKLVLSYENLLAGPLRASRPVELYLLMSDRRTPQEQAFVRLHRPQVVGNFAGASLLRLPVGP